MLVTIYNKAQMRLLSKNASNAAAGCRYKHIEYLKKSKLCKVISFQNKLLNKSKSMHLQKTTLNEGAGTKIIIWQYHSIPLAHPAPSIRSVQQGGWSSPALLPNPVTSAAGDNSRLVSPAGISHGRQSVPLHNEVPAGHPLPTSL